MLKKTEIWGDCPYRRLGWVRNGGGWSYICGKTDEGCSPNYCLGPDEDQFDVKGDENEQKCS